MAMRRLLFGLPAPGARAADVGLLILRLIGGLTLALAHGLGKLPPAAGFVGGIGKMGFPAPQLMAWGVAAVEFGGGLLLALGLLTRPAALVVAINFLVISLYVHRADPFRDREPAVLFLMLGLTLLFAGPGRYSLDALIAGREERRG